VRLDWIVLAFTFAITLATGIFAGILPAWQAARANQQEVLQEGGRGRVGSGRGGLRNALIVSEIALAFVLTVGTSLLTLSLVRLLGVNPGFNSRNVYTADFFVIGPKYSDAQYNFQFTKELADRVGKLPGVESAALTTMLPLNGSWDRRSLARQDKPMRNSDLPAVDSYYVTTDYFRTLGIPVLRGRLFTTADVANSQTAPVAIISQTTADKMFAGENPLGKQIQLGGWDDKKPWATIIGIVPDVRQYGLDTDPTADVYWLDFLQPGTFVIHSSLSQPQLTQAIKQQLAELDKTIPLYDVEMMDDMVARTVAQRRFVATLVGGFGAIALFMAGIGVFGVMAYHVAQRTGEIGVRMALGATPGSIVQMVAGQGAKMALAGSLAGVLLAVAMSRILENQLFHVKPGDPYVLLISATVIGVISFLACYIPARRASRVDPLVALRHD
jgi:predicted permease